MMPESFGPYTLVRRLATGGMGELFLAQRDGLAGFSKQLVVKRIRTELADDREFVEMFLAEGRVAALLDHPHIVHIYDLGQVEGIYYLAMEYVAGRDLGTVLSRNGGPVDLGCALSVLIGACEGVGFAHDATGGDGNPLGLVHRDINPQNILISYRGSVSITDFGIAKVRSWPRAETRAGVLKGKFGYLAPEQARSGKIDRRSDIYALGLLLFEATLGQRAIPGRSDTELLYAAAEGVTQRPKALNRDYPPALEQIFLKATARSPERRYQTVRELQHDLAQFQMEQWLLATSSNLAELMQRLFASEWNEERRLMTPTSAHPVGNALHEQPTVIKPTTAPGRASPSLTRPVVLKADDPARRDPSVRKFVNAPTIHEFSQQDDLAQTVTDLPPYEEITAGQSAATPDPQATSPNAPNPAAADPALAQAKTQILMRDEPQRAADPALAQAKTRILDRGDDPILHGDWTTEDVVARPGKRWLVIVASTLVTLGLGGGAAYYFLLRPPPDGASAPDSGTQRGVATLDSRAKAALDAMTAVSTAPLEPADAQSTHPADLAPRDASPPDTRATPDTRITPDTRATRTTDTRPAVHPLATATGTVRVSSTPATRIFWRGRSLGQTPVTVTVESGRQRLLLRNPSLGINVARSVTVRPGTTSSLDIQLKQGELLVKARPWAHVEMNGKRLGTTPMKAIKLYEGRHTITLINTDKNVTHTVQVVIRPGQTTRLVHRF